jgi:Ca2+-transporting ATPase
VTASTTRRRCRPRTSASRWAGGAILPLALIGWSLLQGLLAFGAVAAVVVWGTRSGHAADVVRTQAWLTLIGIDVALVLTNRRYSASPADVLGRASRSLWWGLGLTALLLALTVFLPPMRSFLAFAPPDASDLAVPLLATLALFGALHAIKPLWAQRLRS